MSIPCPVLIVEDDMLLADAICHQVDRWIPNAQCHIAPNLHEAVEMIETQMPPFRVAVVDLSLPDTRYGSLDAVYALYTMSPELPMIICTGTRQVADVERYGVRTWIIKGVHFWPALQAALQEACADALTH